MKLSKIKLCTLIILALLPAHQIKCFAWKFDVHRDDTKTWTKELYSDNSLHFQNSLIDESDAAIVAKMIAASDIEVDKNPGFKKDRSRHFNKRENIGDKDTRIVHAKKSLRAAKKYLRQIPGKTTNRKAALNLAAIKEIGHGLHSLQDFYAHMDTNVLKLKGYSKIVDNNSSKYSVKIADKIFFLSKSKPDHSTVIDNPLWDVNCYSVYAKDSWHRVLNKEQCTRWQYTKTQSEDYLLEFLTFDYVNNNENFLWSPFLPDGMLR